MRWTRNVIYQGFQDNVADDRVDCVSFFSCSHRLVSDQCQRFCKFHVLNTEKFTTIGICCVCAEAARIVYEICLALEFLHTNDIAHRDLKVRE